MTADERQYKNKLRLEAKDNDKYSRNRSVLMIVQEEEEGRNSKTGGGEKESTGQAWLGGGVDVF